MMKMLPLGTAAVSGLLFVLVLAAAPVEKSEELPRAFVDGTGPGWKPLTLDDFVNVNCDRDTWTWSDEQIHCTGRPVGVCRSKVKYTNFELVAKWRHNKSAGNSGIFVWVPEDVLKELKSGKLPSAGIEVQILDHGYVEQYEKQTKKKAQGFTTNGDVFRSARRR